MPRLILGSLLGTLAAALLAPAIKPLFGPPAGGVGWVTVAGYPKSWDYAVIALLVLGAFAGGALASLKKPPAVYARQPKPRTSYPVALLVFVLMLLVHDHPFVHMDMFHEGEHLTPAYLLRAGERPYEDFFVLHGLASDGGIDALILGSPPSPLRARRVQTVLDAATLALLVPIAAELTASGAALILAVLASLCAIGAGQVPVFPYYRLLPLVVATLALLRYVRTGRPLALLAAFLAGTLGILWSLDTGSYALAGTAAAFVVLHLFRMVAQPLPLKRVAIYAGLALLAPLVVLLAVRADLRQFFVDSFVIIPSAIDAVWARPAPQEWKSGEALRYYLPPAIYGFLLAYALYAWRRGDRPLGARIAIVTILSIVAFRTAAGRVSWSHTRFATPFLGIAIVAFLVEPLARLKRWRIAALLLAIPLFFYFEVAANVAAAGKFIAGWRARQQHEGLVPYPMAAGRGIYTSPQNAEALATLRTFLDSLGPREATILDFSNERALYYFLRRKPPVRCFDIPMLSAPPLLAEAMAELSANPPVAVIVEGEQVLFHFDGVSNRQRVPQLAEWIDANYPKRTQIGRFIVATR